MFTIEVNKHWLLLILRFELTVFPVLCINYFFHYYLIYKNYKETVL